MDRFRLNPSDLPDTPCPFEEHAKTIDSFMRS